MHKLIHAELLCTSAIHSPVSNDQISELPSAHNTDEAVGDVVVRVVGEVVAHKEARRGEATNSQWKATSFFLAARKCMWIVTIQKGSCPDILKLP